MRAAAPIALLLGLACAAPVWTAPAAAQAGVTIPNSEMPGRERDRFFDRFPGPDRLRNDPGLHIEKPERPRRKAVKCRNRPDSRRPDCRR